MYVEATDTIAAMGTIAVIAGTDSERLQASFP
jgi:hypothetical protein